MYNLYNGNTGKVVRIDESRERPRGGAHGLAPPLRPGQQNAVRRQNGGGLMERLSGLLNIGNEELETEDLILLMILYLMYRESGDSELLIIMGAMFLL